MMIVIGAVSFAPLGYFIYLFSKDSEHPFGVFDPDGDHHSAVNDFAEKAIALVKNQLNKNKPAAQ